MRLPKALSALAVAVLLSMSTPLCASADETPTPSPSPSPKAAASSSSSNGLYLGLGVGAAFPGGLSDQAFSRTSTTGISANVNQGYSPNTGLLLSGQVGYQFDKARVEGEFVYQNWSRKSTTATVTGSATASGTYTVGGPNISAYSAMVNGYYDFRSQSKFVPYLGAGLGVTWLDSGNQTTGGVIVQSPNLNTSVFTYQAKLGMSYEMSPQSALFLQYRYMGTSSFNYAGARINLGGEIFNVAQKSGSLSNSSIELGARFKL